MVLVDEIYTLGRADDRKRREESCRRDDVERRTKVDAARESLYNEGYAITGEYVDGVLKDESLVPTKVSASLLTLFARLNVVHTECIFGSALSVWLRLPQDADCRPPT